MSFQRIVLFALVIVLAAPSSAFAQDDDDLLAPPTPQTKPSRSKSGKTKVVKKKATREKATKVTKKPAKTPKTTKTARGKAGKKPVAAPAEDDLLAPLAPQKTELVVRMTGGVRGARLQVDGRDVGPISAAPMPVEVTPGEHLLVVRKPGYAEYSRRIDAKEGSQTEVAVALDATMGFATLTADVPEATVAVDGQDLGPVPLANVLLKPGSREIEFRAPGFKPDVHNITVFAGRPYVIEGKLRPLLDTSVAANDVPRNTVLNPATRPETSPGVSFDPPAPSDDVEVSSGKPWYGRWYVWAGVGAVVAAGTVGAVMATRDSVSPLDANRDVCGGTCDGVLGGVRPVRGGQDKSGGAFRVPAGALRF